VLVGKNIIFVSLHQYIFTMPKKISDDNIIGKAFGMLTVVSWAGIYGSGTHAKRMALCKCSCGIEKDVRLASLLSGNTTSCGCIQKPYENKIKSKYGVYHTQLLHIYKQILRRCGDPSDVNYHNYGGRGIEVCKEWAKDFIVFYDWAISNGWLKGKEIDRENNNEGYSPSNCRIVTKSVNARNRRDNRVIELDGVSMTMIEWAEKTGIEYDVIRYRLDQNWPPELVFSKETFHGKHSAKKVAQFDKGGILIKEYESLQQAAAYTKIDKTSIGRVANGVNKYKTAGGFVWKWV
jgi:hypothetical protein